MYVDMDEVTHEEYQENFAEFMDDIQNHVKKLAAESSRAPQDAYEAFQGKTNGWVSLACLLPWSFLDSLLFTCVQHSALPLTGLRIGCEDCCVFMSYYS